MDPYSPIENSSYLYTNRDQTDPYNRDERLLRKYPSPGLNPLERNITAPKPVSPGDFPKKPRISNLTMAQEIGGQVNTRPMFRTMPYYFKEPIAYESYQSWIYRPIWDGLWRPFSVNQPEDWIQQPWDYRSGLMGWRR